MDKLERTGSYRDTDPTAAGRKRDHIEMAFHSQVLQEELDVRFAYEPLLSAHPLPGSLPEITFLGKKLKAPIWVSSMTGGTEWAYAINRNLARACGEFGMGMGLGSCRSLLFSRDTLKDFDVRELIGDELPLFANLGIAQVEKLIENGQLWRIDALLDLLRADGLIIHVNPLQEWLQPEGDRLAYPPLITISALLEKMPHMPVLVKEVGQGMGIESLRALLQLPLAAIDFAAGGGTNFAKLELLRSERQQQSIFAGLSCVGHTAQEMVHTTNLLLEELGDKVLCRQVIISGGIRSFLDGYYLIHKIRTTAIYGQASAFLRHARGEYSELRSFVESQIRGLELAQAFLRVR